MTTAAPRRSLASLLEVPAIADVHAPRWFNRLPRRVSAAAVLLVLVAVSAFVRTRLLSGELWFNEAIATGIASHSVGAMFGILRQGGSAPLYYLLLHFWISAFGSGESATHALSVLISVLSIPGRHVGGLEPVRPPSGNVRRGAVRVQRVSDPVLAGNAAV